MVLIVLLAGCNDRKPLLKNSDADDPVQLGRHGERPTHDGVVTFYALGCRIWTIPIIGPSATTCKT